MQNNTKSTLMTEFKQIYFGKYIITSIAVKSTKEDASRKYNKMNINYTFDEFPEDPFYQLDPTGKLTNKRFTYSLQTGEAIMIGCTYIRNNELIKKAPNSNLRYRR